jgi:hypothetical protein
MTDDKTPTPDDEPTVPLPAAEPATASAPPESAPATPAAAPAAPTPAATTRSPWPVLLPVLVGVGALLLGGIIGGASGFAVGSRLGGDRGPMVEYRMPDLPRDDEHRGPHDAPGAPDGQVERGGVVNGTLSELSDDELTLELANGETLTISISDDTPVVEANASDISELAAGDELSVVIRRDGDGNPEARLIRTGDVVR